MKTVLTVVILICSSALAWAQQPLSDQLRKGIVQEEANQNLDKAITAYKAIITQYDQDRQAAATALFRLAECYRKTGKRELAVAAYQRVVREFSDQAALVEPSRQQLASTYGIAEPKLARSAGNATTLAQTNEALAKRQHDLQLLEERVKAYQAKIKAGTATPDSEEYVKLRRDLEAAQRNALVASAGERELKREREDFAAQQGASSPESLRAAQIEIEAMQKRLARSKNMVETGLLAPGDFQQLQAEYEQLILRYQRLQRERQEGEVAARVSNELNERRAKSLEAEIVLVQQRIALLEKTVDAGTASSGNAELLQLRRDLLSLQRQLDELKITMKR